MIVLVLVNLVSWKVAIRKNNESVLRSIYERFISFGTLVELIEQ